MRITGRCLCGAVTYTAKAEPIITRFVRAGTLDDSAVAKPTIWTKSAPRWACVNETLPPFVGQPPAPSVTQTP